jgi:hypothetical protein
MNSSFGLDAVNVALLPEDNGKQGNKPLPLVITPRWHSSKLFIVSWCRENREWLDTMLLTYGAILLRGFSLDNPADMQETIQAYHNNLNNTYRGTSPRSAMEGTDYVFSAAEVPANYPIAQHLEMSFLDAPPRQLFFGCIKQSDSPGGETALADFRQVYRDLDTDLKQKLLDQGIRYQRTHKKVGSYYTFDVADMLGWPEVFGTDDKEQVEKMCAEEGVPVEWDGDTFVSVTKSDAFQLHPITKEPVWFNHTQVFHWSTFPAELWFAFCRTHDIRLLIHCFIVAIFCVIKYALFGHEMSFHATFGDGTPISLHEMHEIRRCIHENMVFNRWAKSDLLLLDNFSMSHGRQPTFDRSRKIVVAWLDPHQKSNDVKSLNMDANMTYSTDNPQERSPDSTLTNLESRDLKEALSYKSLWGSLKESFAPPENPQEMSPVRKHVSFVADAEFWEKEE